MPFKAPRETIFFSSFFKVAEDLIAAKSGKTTAGTVIKPTELGATRNAQRRVAHAG